MEPNYNIDVSSVDMSSFDPNATAGLAAVAGAFFVAYMIVMIAVSAVMIVSMWKIFIKAGKPGWVSLVPVYNIVVLLKLVGMNPWLLLTFLIPFVNFVSIPVVMIMLNIKLAKAFGQEGAFAAGLVLLPVVFYPILGFGKAKFIGVEEVNTQNLPVEPVAQTPAPETQTPVSTPTDPTITPTQFQ